MGDLSQRRDMWVTWVMYRLIKTEILVYLWRINRYLYLDCTLLLAELVSCIRMKTTWGKVIMMKARKLGMQGQELPVVLLGLSIFERKLKVEEKS